ncbi:hypothetical protein ACVMB0_004104 [Bradyrhizobium sp. USDA 4451]
MPAGDPAPADRVRYVEGAVHHDVGHGIKPSRGELLGARDEIAGSVVDQIGEGTAGGPDRLDHLVDRHGVADIDAVADHASAMLGHQFGGGLVADALASAADMHLGPELEEAGGHGLAEAGAAAGYQDAPPGKKLIGEHRFLHGGCQLIGRLTKSGQRPFCKAPTQGTKRRE